MNETLADLRDTKFILYDMLNIENLCKSEKFQDHSKDTFEMAIDTAEKLALNDFAPVNSEGDSIGCKLQNDVVHVPHVYHEPFRRFCKDGWISMAEGHEVDGQNFPMTVQFACYELFYSANHSLTGYMGLTHSAAKVIEKFGTPEQKEKYMKHLYSGRFYGGMNLTEPQAGSDVGAVKLKAIRKADGTFSLQGTKIFITGGDNDLVENIIHIVIARIEGDPDGTKGLTCFVVPKMKVNNDGTVGKSNNITCGGVESKMGMKGSATCVLNYGENGECIGELLGPEREGIRVMFNMMNEQRLLVGLQGLAIGSASYMHALKFAKERLQGAAIGSKGTGQVAIIKHPDVMNNLMIMKARLEGMRALILFTVSCLDEIATGVDKKHKQELSDIIELVTPVCKSYSTEFGFDVCVRAMQVHGGYGYCKEYHVEQFLRDCKITTIFEGANGIQAIDLLGRKIKMRSGELFTTLMSRIKSTIKEAGNTSYAGELSRSLDSLEKVTGWMRQEPTSDESYLRYAHASSYLNIFGDILLGWIFLWQSMIAEKKLQLSADSPEAAFCKEKIQTARFYIGTLLPSVHGRIDAIMKDDRSLLELRGLFI